MGMLPVRLAGSHRKELKGIEALEGEPIEFGARVGWTQDERAVHALKRKRAGFDRLAACGECKEARLEFVEVCVLTQCERGDERRVKSDIAVGEGREFGIRRTGHTC